MSASTSAVGESLRAMAFCVAASSSSAARSRPRARRTSASESVESRSGVRDGELPFFEEGIVGLQVMGLDDEGVGGRVSGDDGLGRLAETAGEAGLIDEGAHVARAERLVPERLRHGLRDLGLAVALDEAMEHADLVLQIDLPARDFVEIEPALGRHLSEAVAARSAVSAGTALNQLFAMLALLDVLVAVPRARMLGDDDTGDDDAHRLVIGAQLRGLADELGWDRVGIGVEADARLFIDDDREEDEVGIEWPRRKWTQSRTLDEEPVGGALAGGGVQALIGRLIAPASGLGAQVFERGEGAPVEERVANVFDARLDAALGLGIAHRRGDGLKQVVPSEVEKLRIELHRSADVVQDDTLEIVVEDLPRHAAEKLEGAAMHAPKRVHALVEREVEKQGTRPGEHHRE